MCNSEVNTATENVIWSVNTRFALPLHKKATMDETE